jgi:glycosyltransferase involved in cell wall biosynthesis
MRVLIVVPWRVDGRGYIENTYPEALASLGVDVTVLTSRLSPFRGSRSNPFAADARRPSIEMRNGITLARTRAIQYRGRTILLAGRSSLTKPPDIIQVFSVHEILSYQAWRFAHSLRVPLFTGCHIPRSLFPAARPVADEREHSIGKPSLPVRVGRFVGRRCARCFAVSRESVDIARDIFRIPDGRLVFQPLGTDTTVYNFRCGPQLDTERALLRERLGISASTRVVVYSGRMEPSKGPLQLASALTALRNSGLDLVGVFIGDGSQLAQLTILEGIRTLGVVSQRELAAMYRLADACVWPLEMSSSQMDALATGARVVVNASIPKPELIDAGAWTCSDTLANDLHSLVRKAICSPLTDRERAERAERVGSIWSWTRMAEERLAIYESYLASAK